MRPSRTRTAAIIGGLALATVAGVVFKDEVLPPTPLLFFAGGSEPATGDAAHFTGRVATDTPFAANGGSAIAGARVAFEAGARTNWHSHPRGQLLVVTAGRGWVQDEGGAKRALAPGDAVWTAPGVKHWHGAGRETRLVHIAIAEPSVTGEVADWGAPVGDATYDAAAGSVASPPEESAAPASVPDR